MDDDAPTPTCSVYLPVGKTWEEVVGDYLCQEHVRRTGEQRQWKWADDLTCFRHVQCTGEGGRGLNGGQCDKCHRLRYNVALQKMLKHGKEPPPHTPYHVYGHRALERRLHRFWSESRAKFVALSASERHIAPLRRKSTVFDRFVDAIAAGDTQRVATIINAAHKRGWSKERITALLEDAMATHRTRYNAKEHDMAIVVWVIGGPSITQVLHAEKMLPSPSHAARLAAKRRITVGADINIDGPVASWKHLPGVPLMLHFDRETISHRRQGRCD